MKLFGKQLTQFLVIANRVVQVIHHHRANPVALQILADGIGQNTGNIPVRLVSELLEIIPDSFLNFRTDLDSSHASRIVDMS